MKLIKRIALIAMTAIIAASFACCNGNKDNSGGGPKETLTVLHYRTEDADFYDWMCREFEKEYNCIVQYDGVPTDGWGTLLEAKLRAGAVDVFGTYPGSVYRDDSNLPFMMDLSDMDFVNKLTDEYVEYAAYTDGKIYNAPLNMVSDTVFYNKTIFNQLGLTEPTNYSEFIAVLEALKAKSKDFGNGGNKFGGVELAAPIIFGGRETWPISMTYNSIEAAVVRTVDPYFYVDVWKNGTKSLDDDIIKETFRKYKEISSYYQINSYGLSYSRVPGKFALGEYGMLIDGSWSYSQIVSANPDIDIGVFPLPANDSSEYKNYTVGKPGSGFAIHKDTKHAELAKAFIEFHYREDVYKRFLDEVKMGSVLKDVQNSTSDAIIAELYNSNYTYIAPLSEYMPSIMSYPHSICEKLALDASFTAENAAAQYLADYNLYKPQLTSPLMERWMGLYNKNYNA